MSFAVSLVFVTSFVQVSYKFRTSFAFSRTRRAFTFQGRSPSQEIQGAPASFPKHDVMTQDRRETLRIPDAAVAGDAVYGRRGHVVRVR